MNHTPITSKKKQTLRNKIARVKTRDYYGVHRHIEVYRDEVLKVIEEFYEHD